MPEVGAFCFTGAFYIYGGERDKPEWYRGTSAPAGSIRLPGRGVFVFFIPVSSEVGIW